MNRPTEVHGITKRIETGCGKIYMTISTDPEYKEVFLRLGKSGGCAAAFLDGVGRLITFCLNLGVEKDTIIRAFAGIRCPHGKWSNGKEVLSCLDGVAKLLEEVKSEVPKTDRVGSPNNTSE